jgi:hypothetical protein
VCFTRTLANRMKGSPPRTGRHAARLVLQWAWLLGASGVRAQDSSSSSSEETTAVYFGSGCFWGRQKDFVDVEEITLGRSDHEVTALVGYAGGPVPKGALDYFSSICIWVVKRAAPGSCAPSATRLVRAAMLLCIWLWPRAKQRTSSAASLLSPSGGTATRHPQSVHHCLDH